MTRLLIGSEGTLGIITEVHLRLFGIPERIAAAVCPFATIAAAVAAVTLVLQIGVPVARIELLDALQMRACVAYSALEGFAQAPTLFLEFHGAPAAVAEQVAAVEAIFAQRGGGNFRWAEAHEERNVLWRARHDVYWAARALRPGCDSFATDACVPISALAACIADATAAAEEMVLIAPLAGHVGDGNCHMLVLHDAADPDERARANALSTRVARLALAHGARSRASTVSGSISCR